MGKNVQNDANSVPFSWLPGEKLQENDTIFWEESKATLYDQLNLPSKSNIERKLNRVLDDYNIDQDERPLILDMIREYHAHEEQLTQAVKRWQNRRGNTQYEATVLLQDEQMELRNILDIARDLEYHTKELRTWLNARGFRSGNPALPPGYTGSRYTIPDIHEIDEP